MKKLEVTWKGIDDPTGYLFSFTKALSAAVLHSPYSDLAEDIIAASGFAFRMWVAADLCPSATSIWDFKKQKPWVENGGLLCGYIDRLWDQDSVEESRRIEAIELSKNSIDRGIPAISWDIGVPEWGLLTGYDDNDRLLATLSIDGTNSVMSYDNLGLREIPILSVLTITGKKEKPIDKLIHDTINLAAAHLRGEEWCENAQGLAAYPALVSHFEEKFTEPVWQMDYYLGTYSALKLYAYKFFCKYELNELSSLYSRVSKSWLEAFDIKNSKDVSDKSYRSEIAALLREAYAYEEEALKAFYKIL